MEQGSSDQAAFQETKCHRSLHVRQSVAVLCAQTTSAPVSWQNDKRHIRWWAELCKSRPRWWPLTCWSSHEPLSLDHTGKKTGSRRGKDHQSTFFQVLSSSPEPAIDSSLHWIGNNQAAARLSSSFLPEHGYCKTHQSRLHQGLHRSSQYVLQRNHSTPCRATQKQHVYVRVTKRQLSQDNFLPTFLANCVLSAGKDPQLHPSHPAVSILLDQDATCKSQGLETSCSDLWLDQVHSSNPFVAATLDTKKQLKSKHLRNESRTWRTKKNVWSNWWNSTFLWNTAEMALDLFLEMHINYFSVTV